MNLATVKEQLKGWLKDEVNLQIFYQFLSSREAKPENLFSSPLFSLKKDKKRKDFIQLGQQYINAISQNMQCCQEKVIEDREKPEQILEYITEKCGHIISVFCIENKSKQQILLGLNQQFSRLFQQEMKIIQRQNKQKFNKKENAAEKLEDIINKILQFYDKTPDSYITKAILKYGSFDCVKNHKCFQNSEFRQKFRSLLQLSISYQQIRKYGGHDIHQKQQSVMQDLQETLINLNINAQLIIQIKNSLKTNPLSCIISNHKELTYNQKVNYYNSKFYQRETLNNYAQILFYSQTTYSNALKDITTIMEIIQENCNGKFSEEFIKTIFKFDLVKLLNIQNVSSIKKLIFSNIKSSCTNYYDAYLSIYYQGKKQESLKINERFQILFNLRKVFLEAKLNFQNWQTIQNMLMNRNQQIIHDLELSLKQKQIIRKFYFLQLQPYFHRIQKRFEFKKQVEQNLLGQLITAKNFQKNKDIDQIMGYIDQIIQNFGLNGKLIQNQLVQKDKNQLNQICKKNKLLQQYIANKGVDKSEEQYQTKQSLMSLIYAINQQNQIQVPYNAIQNLISYIITNKLAVPTQYPQYACDLSKLKDRFSPSNEPEPTNKKQPDIEYLIKQRDQLLKSFNEYLSKTCSEQSLLIGIRNLNYNGKQTLYCQLLLNLNPFQNEVDLVRELQINGLKAGRFKRESREFYNTQVKNYLNNYRLLNQQIRKINPLHSSDRIAKNINSESPRSSRPSIAVPPLNLVHKINKTEQIQKFQHLLIENFNNFKNQLNISSSKTLLKVIQKHYSENPNIFIERIFKSNPFQNPETSSIYDELKEEYIITALQIKSFKAQITKIADIFGKKYANQYANLMSNLKKLKDLP